MILRSPLYDNLKFITQIVLPALGTLYFALAGIWGLPAAEQIVGTIVAVDTFLGVVLQISTSQYKNSEERFDGALNVEKLESGNKNFSLELNSNPEDLENKSEIVFKVKTKKGRHA